MHFKLAALLVAAALVAFPGESEARRFGSRSSSHRGAEGPSVRHSSNESSSSGNYVGHVIARSRNSSNSADPAGTDALPAGAATQQAAAPSPEELRRRAEKQAADERAFEERKATYEREKAERERQVALAAAERAIQERAQKAENLRLAKLAEDEERARKRLARERLCVIQPVMTDAEIANCKEVWR